MTDQDTVGDNAQPATQSEVPDRLLPLSEGERLALEAVKSRKLIDLSTNDIVLDDPDKAATWGEERQLRARFLEWLLTESGHAKELPSSRLDVRGARINGPIDLSFRTITAYLVFNGCSIAAGMRLSSARLRGLELRRVVLESINAWALLVEGPVIFEQVTLSGVLQFPNGKVTGDLALRYSKVNAGGITALNANNLMVGGNFSIEDSDVTGRVNLIGASIDGDCALLGGSIGASITPTTQGTVAVNADGIKIKGRCFVRNQIAVNGTLRMMAATIAGELDLGTSRVFRPGDNAVDLRNTRIGGGLFMSNGFEASGRIMLSGCDIGGELNLSGAKITSAFETALDARSCKVKAHVLLTNGFDASGRVTFAGSEIGGELNLSGGKISRSYNDALDIRGCKTKGGVFLTSGFSVEGSINAYGAEIGGDFDCRGTHIVKAGDRALDARRARVKAAVLLVDGFYADRPVTFFGATIEGDFNLIGSDLKPHEDELALELGTARLTTFLMQKANVTGTVDLYGASLGGDIIVRDTSIVTGRHNRALNLDNARGRSFVIERHARVKGLISTYGAHFSRDVIVRNSSIACDSENDLIFNGRSMRCDGALHWRNIEPRPTGVVTLEQAHVGELSDELDSWPPKLQLAGFTFDRLAPDAYTDVTRRLDWLKRQPRYYSQPFEHLIAMYRKVGDSNSAAKVAMAKWRTRRAEMKKWSAGWIWDRFLDLTSGYGYIPERPLIALVVLIALGSLVFFCGHANGAFCDVDTIKKDPPCTTPPHYPQFSPLGYSIETLAPLGDFGQRRWYVLRGDSDAAAWVGGYSIFHRALGWIFSLLLALAPTNVLRRE